MNRLISYFLCQNNNFTSAKLRPKFRNNYESWLETVNKNDLIIRQTAKSLYKYGLLSKSGRFLVITADSQNRTDFVQKSDGPTWHHGIYQRFNKPICCQFTANLNTIALLSFSI
jgi:hypothetical protein